MGGQAGQVLCSTVLLSCPITQETDCEADPTVGRDPASRDPAVRRDPASLVLQNRLAQVVDSWPGVRTVRTNQCNVMYCAAPAGAPELGPDLPRAAGPRHPAAAAPG